MTLCETFSRKTVGHQPGVFPISAPCRHPLVGYAAALVLATCAYRLSCAFAMVISSPRIGHRRNRHYQHASTWFLRTHIKKKLATTPIAVQVRSSSPIVRHVRYSQYRRGRSARLTLAPLRSQVAPVVIMSRNNRTHSRPLHRTVTSNNTRPRSEPGWFHIEYMLAGGTLAASSAGLTPNLPTRRPCRVVGSTGGRLARHVQPRRGAIGPSRPHSTVRWDRREGLPFPLQSQPRISHPGPTESASAFFLRLA